MSYKREHDQNAIPLLPVQASDYPQWLDNAPSHHKRWLESAGFKAEPGKWCGLPDERGALEACVFGMEDHGWLYQLTALPAGLPAADYRLVCVWSREQRIQASLGWGFRWRSS